MSFAFARLRIVAGALFLSAASVASAQQVIVNQNFDDPANPPAYNYSYTYAGGANIDSNGNPIPMDLGGYTSAVSSVFGSGKGGGNALNVVADFSGLATQTAAQQVWYWGFGGGFGKPVPGLPTPNYSDYRMTANITTSGAQSSPAAVTFQVQLQIPNPAGGNNINFAEIDYPVNVGTSYSTYSFTLDQGTVKYDSSIAPENQSLQAEMGNINAVNFNFDVNGSVFGEGANKQVSIDDVNLTDSAVATPEPASASLALVLGAAGLLVRRRKSA